MTKIRLFNENGRKFPKPVENTIKLISLRQTNVSIALKYIMNNSVLK